MSISRISHSILSFLEEKTPHRNAEPPCSAGFRSGVSNAWKSAAPTGLLFSNAWKDKWVKAQPSSKGWNLGFPRLELIHQKTPLVSHAHQLITRQLEVGQQ